MKRDFIIHARIFKAMSDENRLKIIDLLKEKERTATELLEAMDFGQSTLSHHMKILIQAGVVGSKRRGKWIVYSIDQEAMSRMQEWLDHYLKV